MAREVSKIARCVKIVVNVMSDPITALLLVKGLPAEVCEECKEVYLPPASVHLLDELMTRQKTPTEFIRIPVYSLP